METAIRVRTEAARFEQAAALLPYDLRQAACKMPERDKARAEEFRLRAGRPPMVAGPAGEREIPHCPGPVRPEDLGLVLEVASRASAHTVLDRVKCGFVTVRGGHRVGICGSAVVRDGEIHNLRQMSSLAIRIAHEVPGAAAGVLPKLLEGGKLHSTLLLSPPGGGKTTLLRDLVRCISDGVGMEALRVGLADERGEVAAMYEGVPQVDVGERTDVMDGCPKGAALAMLLRGMNPQVLAADEITAPADCAALALAANCGVTLLATAHGEGLEDLRRRPMYRELLEQGIFRRLVLLTRTDGARSFRVEPLEGTPC